MDLSMIRQQSLINYSIHNAILLQNFQFQQINQQQHKLQFNMRKENDIIQPEKKKVRVNPLDTYSSFNPKLIIDCQIKIIFDRGHTRK